mmetsp:Transcript_27246/g.45578  ORF Transcript_27246/g.45578 Transcript_27246/m.45578 type:complete len:238 (-) Transcript_27246:506-1219(-)
MPAVVRARLVGDLNDVRAHPVEKVLAMADQDQRLLVVPEALLQPHAGLEVEMVGGLVQEQDVRVGEQQAADGHAASLASTERGHQSVRGGAAQGFHGTLLDALDLPPVLGVDLGLQALHLLHQRVHVRRRVPHRCTHLIKIPQEAAQVCERRLDVALHREPIVEGRLLLQVPNFDAINELAVALEFLVRLGQNFQQSTLTGSIGSKDPDLGAQVHPETDVLQDLLAAGHHLGHFMHG